MNENFNLKKLFDWFDYIFYFFSLNLFFLILNIPLVWFIMFVGISKASTYLPLFLLCLIPTGTSLTAMLYCMGKLLRDKSLNVFQDFMKGIKSNLKQSLFFWLSELIIVFILYFNIKFFSTVNYNLILIGIFIFISILIATTTPYIYILMSRFSMKNIDLLKTSLILTFTRPLMTVSNILICLVSLLLFEMVPGAMCLFIFSIFTFLLSYINRALISQLELLSKNTTA